VKVTKFSKTCQGRRDSQEDNICDNDTKIMGYIATLGKNDIKHYVLLTVSFFTVMLSVALFFHC